MLAPVGAASTASASRTIRVAIAILRSSGIRPTPAAMATRADGHRVALDHASVGKSSGVHAIVGGEVAADVECNQRSVLFG